MTPAIAEAAVVSALARYNLADFVPDRPSKLRLLVRRDTAFVAGACPIPTQGPHAHSRILAPASTRLVSIPSLAVISNTWREPGATTRLVLGAT